MPGELRQRDLVATTERVIRADQQEQVLGEQRLDRELGLVDGQVDDRGVVLTGKQRRDEDGRAALGDDRSDLGIAGRGLGEQPREQPPGGGAENPEANVADDVSVVLGHVGGDVVELPQHSTGPLDHPHAVVGQPAVRPVDERGAELLLQVRDVARDVRLHRVQRASRRRERAVVGDGDECRELPDVHVHSTVAVAISQSDRRHQNVLLVRSIACAYHHKHKVEAIHPPCTAR